MQDKQVEIAFSQDYRIVRPDATLRWIRERTFPIRNGAGKVVRVVGIAEDITRPPPARARNSRDQRS